MTSDRSAGAKESLWSGMRSKQRAHPCLFHRSAYCTAAKVSIVGNLSRLSQSNANAQPNALLTLVKRQLPPARNCLGLRLIEARLVCFNPWNLDLNKCTPREASIS